MLKFHLQHSFLPHHKTLRAAVTEFRFFFFLQCSSEILHSISLLQIKFHATKYTIIKLDVDQNYEMEIEPPPKSNNSLSTVIHSIITLLIPTTLQQEFVLLTVSSWCTKFCSLKPFCAMDHEFKHLNIIKQKSLYTWTRLITKPSEKAFPSEKNADFQNWNRCRKNRNTGLKIRVRSQK